MPTVVTHYKQPLPTGPLPEGDVLIGYGDPDMEGGDANVWILTWDEEEHKKSGGDRWKGIRLDEGVPGRTWIAGDPLTFLKSWVHVEKS